MPFPFRRVYAQQVFHKEISSAVLAVIAAHGMAHAGYKEEVYVLIGFDDGVYELESGGGVHVIIHFTQDQQELSLELVGVGYIG